VLIEAHLLTYLLTSVINQ